ncbi:hypothetical protein [Nocardia sp. NPDC057455]|uniref:hypothetical protein n=1 Tax=Nocardia sp. NPDC057455 TaxID=3346138 RepID=UPI0036714987
MTFPKVIPMPERPAGGAGAGTEGVVARMVDEGGEVFGALVRGGVVVDNAVSVGPPTNRHPDTTKITMPMQSPTNAAAPVL